MLNILSKIGKRNQTKWQTEKAELIKSIKLFIEKDEEIDANIWSGNTFLLENLLTELTRVDLENMAGFTTAERLRKAIARADLEGEKWHTAKKDNKKQ